MQDTTQRGILRQAEVLDENRIVLYKKGHQLGRGYYIVEISSNNSQLYIAAYDVESPESFLIELPEKKAQEILEQFNSEYETIASNLNVINKRLVLMNPNYQPPAKKKEDRLASAPGTQRRLIGSQRTQRNSRLPSSGANEFVFSADTVNNSSKNLIGEGKKQAAAMASEGDNNTDEK
jgi:hypothetical protein